MRILIVTQYFYPDIFRINEVSFELARAGHEVTVLTGLPDYSSGKVPREYKWGMRRDEVIRGVRVVRVPVIARRKGAFLRALNYASFLFCSVVKSVFLGRDFDVVMCFQTSPVTMAEAALRVKRRLKINMLLYCLDIWPESLKSWGFRERSPLFKIMRVYSKRICRNADIIAVGSQPFTQYLSETHGVDKNKIVYLPQHADEMRKCPAEEKAERDTVRFVYAGNIGKAQGCECIVRAAARLKETDNFRVDIFGSGTCLEECAAQARESGVTDKILFHGRIDKDTLAAEYSKADALLITLASQGAVGLTCPAKLQEYMSAGKPVIAAIAGDAERIIREAGCGLVSAPGDDIALAESMQKVIADPGRFKRMGENGYNYYLNNFTLFIFIGRLMGILYSLYWDKAEKKNV